MNFERCTDWDLIKAIVTHPRLYRHLHDDHGPAPEEWEPVDAPGLVSYMLAKDGEEILGVFIVSAHSRYLWELHQVFLPHAWGERARVAAIEFREWIWQKTSCVRLIGNIVRSNRLALRFAKAAGMREYGVQPKCFMKDGKLQDIVMVAVDRPRVEV